jgi:UDP-3-O-acyl-N-acetylglucosamine deacetylase
MSPQRTIQESQKCEGLGVRYGKLITLGIHPAPPDTGVVFIRTDLEGKPHIKASIAYKRAALQEQFSQFLWFKKNSKISQLIIIPLR